MSGILYLECGAGISGDMIAAALLDLGADEKKLLDALDSLHLWGFRYAISRVKKSGLDACDFAVIPDAEYETHDHDMAYLHGKASPDREASLSGRQAESGAGSTTQPEEKEPGPVYGRHGLASGEGTQTEEENQRQAHGQRGLAFCESTQLASGLSQPAHDVSHRGLEEIFAVIRASRMTGQAKALAERIFGILADAEAKAHGVSPKKVHFHEVGAADSIADICAAAVCLDDLGVTEVVIPDLSEGYGTVRCRHGVIPVPVPAVLNIVSAYQIPLRRIDVEGEFVTPTGAAIAAAIRTQDTLPERYIVKRVGLGAGKRTYERPSLLRAMLIEPAGTGTRETALEEDEILELQCNVDDCTGEALGYAMECLFAAGARDVSYAPVFMKKNRPGWLITVICTREEREKIESVLFAQTTTIGVRCKNMQRRVLERHSETVLTSLGEVCFKMVQGENGIRAVPEYESVAAIARLSGLPFQEVYRRVEEEANRKLHDPTL